MNYDPKNLATLRDEELVDELFYLGQEAPLPEPWKVHLQNIKAEILGRMKPSE